MAETTNISWCDSTFNPWRGCTPVSPGCAHCYAAALSKRTGGPDYRRGVPRLRTKTWGDPVKWNKAAANAMVTYRARLALGYAEEPRRPRVFCASLADWLDDEVPIVWLRDLLRVIYDTPHLDWLLLTKRPGNFAARVDEASCSIEGGGDGMAFYEWVQAWLKGSPPANVWIGTTVEDQTRADERIPELLKIPARVRFLSCEPLLGPVLVPLVGQLPGKPDGYDEMPPEMQARKVDEHARATYIARCSNGIHWVITGGESGPKARPADLEWFRSLRDQCKAAEIAYFMKQLGGTRSHHGDLSDFPEDLRVREFPGGKEGA